MTHKHKHRCGGTSAHENPLKPIKNIIIINIENRSFDNLYGLFEGANGLSQSTVKQVDANGVPFQVLPPVLSAFVPPTVDPRFPTDLPNQPFLTDQYASPNEEVESPFNGYFEEILATNNGKMDGFITFCGLPYPGWPGPNPTPFNTIGFGGSIPFGYSNTQRLPVANVAKRFTLCDNNFQNVLGGSDTNTLAGATGAPVKWNTAIAPVPPSIVSVASPVPFQVVPGAFVKKEGTLDGDLVVISNIKTANQIFPKFQSPNNLPSLDVPTIGDQLDSKRVSWLWYSYDWNAAKAGNVAISQHTSPFLSFTNFSATTNTSPEHTHVKDISEFLTDLNAGTLPRVTWLKPAPDEHPGLGQVFPNMASLMQGETHTWSLIQAIMNSKVWEDCVVFVTYDECGGFFDHAVPPVFNADQFNGFGAEDGYGPGPRTPAIVISPFARRKFVDHTLYQTDMSIARFLERRFNLPPLTPRIGRANDFTNALNFVNGRLVRSVDE